MDIKKLSSQEELELLKKALLISASRYGMSGGFFHFKKIGWEWEPTLESILEDIRTNKEIRKSVGWKLSSKKITPSIENLQTFINAARLILGRYSYPNMELNFIKNLSGNADDIILKLKDDYWKLVELINFLKKDPSSLYGCSINIRVLATIEGLIFQAIRSLVPFSGKRGYGPGHIRYMRCLEGLLFQIGKTIDPDFTTKQKYRVSSG